MDATKRAETVTELKSQVNKQQTINLILAIGMVLLVVIDYSHGVILQVETPGMPNGSVIERSSMDRGAEKAVLVAVTNALVSLNPGNVTYQKSFVQSYLAEQVFTRVSQEMDNKAALLEARHESGSYYFVLRGYRYDPKLDKHYILAEVHTVNAAKDTATNYVYEYKMHVENYRAVIDDIILYPGDQVHDSKWLEAMKK